MERPTDKHHMVYFVRDGKKIGAAQYNTYQSEDGKCFMLDFWVFPEYRGNGPGHACFEAFEAYKIITGVGKVTVAPKILAFDLLDLGSFSLNEL